VRTGVFGRIVCRNSSGQHKVPWYKLLMCIFLLAFHSGPMPVKRSECIVLVNFGGTSPHYLKLAHSICFQTFVDCV